MTPVFTLWTLKKQNLKLPVRLLEYTATFLLLQVKCFYFTQKLLESINTLKVEEWDTNSLQVVEREDVIAASTLPSTPPLLHDSEDEGDSAEMTCNWIQRDTEDAAGDILPYIRAETFAGIQQTDLHTSPLAFASGYTTMEMFQQVTPQGVPANASVTQESKSEEADLTVVKSGLDYVRKISASSILDNKDTSTIL